VTAHRFDTAMVLQFGAILAVGLIALCLGSAFGYDTRTMHGIAIGCIPTGSLGIVLSILAPRIMAARRPSLVTQGPDERVRFINGRASCAALQVLFGWVFLYTVLSPAQWIRSISHTVFGSLTLVFMSLVYAAAVAVYSRRY
jgi:hypothetical protein